MIHRMAAITVSISAIKKRKSTSWVMTLSHSRRIKLNSRWTKPPIEAMSRRNPWSVKMKWTVSPSSRSARYKRSRSSLQRSSACSSQSSSFCYRQSSKQRWTRTRAFRVSHRSRTARWSWSAPSGSKLIVASSWTLKASRCPVPPVWTLTRCTSEKFYSSCSRQFQRTI